SRRRKFVSTLLTSATLRAGSTVALKVKPAAFPELCWHLPCSDGSADEPTDSDRVRDDQLRAWRHRAPDDRAGAPPGSGALGRARRLLSHPRRVVRACEGGRGVGRGIPRHELSLARDAPPSVGV